MTRNIYDKDGNIIGTLTLSDGASEEEWSRLLNEYATDASTITWEKIRKKRSELFKETEWIKFRHRDQKEANIQTTLTEEQYQEWLDYWQALRDLPNNFQNPEEVVWPDKPTE